jgi:hypothetical protein
MTVLAAVVWKFGFGSADLDALRNLEDIALLAAAWAPKARNMNLPDQVRSPIVI